MRTIPIRKVTTPVACHADDLPIMGSQFAKHNMGCRWTVSDP